MYVHCYCRTGSNTQTPSGTCLTGKEFNELLHFRALITLNSLHLLPILVNDKGRCLDNAEVLLGLLVLLHINLVGFSGVGVFASVPGKGDIPSAIRSVV